MISTTKQIKPRKYVYVQFLKDFSI